MRLSRFALACVLLPSLLPAQDNLIKDSGASAGSSSPIPLSGPGKEQSVTQSIKNCLT